MNNYQEENKSKFKNLFFTSEGTRSKNKLLSLSLMWLGIGVITIFLISFLLLSFPKFLYDLSVFFNYFWLMMTIINVVLLISMFAILRNNNTSIKIAVLLYVAFVVFEGFYLSTSFVWYNVTSIKDLIPLFLIPIGIFVLMGIFGYFNIFDFTKLAPFLMFATIGLMIFSFFSFFFYRNSTTEIIFSLVGLIIFILWIGFDLQRIIRIGQNLDFYDKKDMLRLSLMFGINLFIDFIQILFFLLRLMRFTNN
ncbi:MAG: Bax inhibitor-1/YccA family protein [Metamycoplasmataceae bacterium]